MLKQKYQIAGGSIVGRLHMGQDGVLVGKNNQDALALFESDELLMAVVCDGCGSEPYSEFGARLGADLIISATRCRLRRGELDCNLESGAAFWDTVRQDVLAQIRVLALAIAGSDSFTETIQRRFLFTVLVALMTKETTQIASIGDGFYALNGRLRRLGPFPDNKPPYLAYGLIDTEMNDQPENLRFTVHEAIATQDVNSLLIGSDGIEDLIASANRCLPGKQELLGSLAQFWEREQYLKNRDAIRRRLVLANSERTIVDRASARAAIHNGLLRDDTTLAVVRRIPQ